MLAAGSRVAAWLRLEEINDVSSSSSCSSPGHETAQLHHSLPGGADWSGVVAHWVTSGVQYGHYRSYTLALALAIELQSEL